MENTNDSIKIKFSTVFAISTIIVLVLLVAVGFLGVKLKNQSEELQDVNKKYSKLKTEKNELAEENEKLNAENKKLNKYVSDIYGDNYIAKQEFFEDFDDIVYSDISYSSKDVSKKSDDEVEEIITEALNLEAISYVSKADLLIELGLVNSKDIKSYEKGELVFDEYYATDIKFEDLKDELLKYVSEDYLIEMLESDEELKSSDGLIYYSYWTSGSRKYEVDSIEKDEYDKNVFHVKAKEYYYDEDDADNIDFFITLLCNDDGNLVVDDVDYYYYYDDDYGGYYDDYYNNYNEDDYTNEITEGM